MSNIEFGLIFAFVGVVMAGWAFGWLMLNQIRGLERELDHQKYNIDTAHKRSWTVSHDLDRLSEALGYEKKESHSIEFVKKGATKP